MPDKAAASCTFINGSATDRVAVDDRGFSYGDGLFETMVWRRPHVELQNLHIDRLLRDCLRLKIPLSRERLEKDWQLLGRHLSEACAGDFGIIKIMVSRGSGERGYSPPAEAVPSLVFNYTRLDGDLYAKQRQHGVDARICELRLAIQPALAGIKHLNRLEQVLARAEWQDPSIFEGILLDREGYLVEATMSNILFCKAGELFAPLVDRCGVAGVMQRYVIESIAPKLGIKVNSGRYRLEEFLAADEWMLSNSILRVCPIVTIESAQRAIGPITQSIQKTLDHMLYA